VKQRIYQIIFEAETKEGKVFDVVLIYVILLSILVTMLDSVLRLNLKYGQLFYTLEIVFTALFTIEYLFRYYCSPRKLSYVFSFFGLIDLLSILPLYISFFIPGVAGLSILRGLRVLRVFRILKLTQYSHASRHLSTALKSSWPKISVFLLTILTAVLIIGALMYLVEGRQNGFTSIPKSVYWAVVTMTTVGYGDLVPKTELGQFISIVLMILGYGVIAVPTGVVSSELMGAMRNDITLNTTTCPNCFMEGHRKAACFCFNCGYKLVK